MEFEWFEAKRQRVLRERGLDFGQAADEFFDGRPLLTSRSSRGGEERRISIGELDGVLVWMERGENIRIITMRRARDGEKKRFAALYG